MTTGNLTIQDNDTVVQYTSVGESTFVFNFPILAASELRVSRNQVLLTYGTDYSITGLGDDGGGYITLLAGASTPGHIWTLWQDMPIERLTGFSAGAATILGSALNAEFAARLRVEQQLRRELRNSLRVPPDDPVAGQDLTLDTRSQRANKYFAWDVNGNPTSSAGTGNDAALRADLGSTVSGGNTLVAILKTTAENAAGVAIAQAHLPPGCVERYAVNVTPGTTDMTAAINAAILQRFNGGENPYLLNKRYRTTAPISIPATSEDLHFWGMPGAQIVCDHTGDCLVFVVQDENSEGNSIEGINLLGPNTLLPPPVPTSVGAGICMNRHVSHTTGLPINVGAETLPPPQYNGFLRNVRVEGFQRGLDMQNVIGLNVFGCVFQFNEYGVRFDGGQTNANKFFGTHIRYNRKLALQSTGRTGGALSNATANTFVGCLIESNTPYNAGFTPGGTPPGDSVGIYLNNSYDFTFVGCYSENHKSGIYLTNSSKGHKFIAHRIGQGGGGTRLDVITLNGAGIYNNEFDIHADSGSLTEINVVSDNANQLWNSFKGSGLNFVAGSVLAPLDFADIKPSLGFSNNKGYGYIRCPSQGTASNVSEGAGPGSITGIGTAGATLHMRGLTEIVLGNGITGATTLVAIDGLDTNRFLVIRNMQAGFAVVLGGAAFGLTGGSAVTLNAVGQQIVFWIDQNGVIREVARNFILSAGAYTVTNPTTDRALNVTADTLPQVAQVLGTLIADLQGRGILS